jgi:hypothetical protein
MSERRKGRAQGDSNGTKMRIFGTNPENPEEGRIFVWTKMGWFERLKGLSGGVAFIPVAKSQEELHEFISRDNPSFDLVPLSSEYRKSVSEEFAEQSESYQDSPEYSHEEPTEDDDQRYHQHD